MAKDMNFDGLPENASTPQEAGSEEHDSTARVTGEPQADAGEDESLSAAERSARARKAQEEADSEAREEEQAGYERGEKVFKKNGEDSGVKETLMGAFQRAALHGVHDRGSHYAFNNKGKVSDKQLRQMLIKGYHVKGWNTMYFYKGNSKIDSELTGRAQAMLSTFQKSRNPKLREIAENMQISGSPMKGREPWRVDPFVETRKNIAAKLADRKDRKLVEKSTRQSTSVLRGLAGANMLDIEPKDKSALGQTFHAGASALGTAASTLTARVSSVGRMIKDKMAAGASSDVGGPSASAM